MQSADMLTPGITGSLCVCCMQLASSEGPLILLHIMPALPDSGQKKNRVSSLSLTRAGDGPGVQVFPGSVSEVHLAQVRERS